ncbi:response regulator [Carboxylicivirga linearis]|uniref:Response regulator transcription factor n=1 Tax=Carboxylicivirga linearis TaxID=1628157 RepID=A0ABS5JYB5_9BACT|nr:response regulator [Carboxylicivirga linearis]MBS2099296.1 response regulator transcription factor [Carboxylicivirga linearis]
MKKQHPNIVIVNSLKSMVDALYDFIESDTDYKIIGNMSEFKKLLKLPQLNEVDMVLVDTIILDENSEDIIEKVKKNSPECKFIAISLYDDQVYLQDYLKIGFSGMVSKNKITEELIETVTQVMEGLNAFPNKN